MTIISFSGYDDNNPLMREWSIILIRNLTESKFDRIITNFR